MKKKKDCSTRKWEADNMLQNYELFLMTLFAIKLESELSYREKKKLLMDLNK